MEEGEDASEHLIDCRVATASIFPALDDSLVVTVEAVVPLWSIQGDNESNEKLEADGFSPSNVFLSVESGPVGLELPCLPL